jgi:hypothetical protein
MIMMVSTAFAVMLAFITIAAFQTYNGAKSGGRAEAVAVLEMSRSAGLLPPADRDAVRADLACYARAVVNLEWETMRDGQRSNDVEHWIDAYRATFNQLDLASPRSQVALKDLLDEARTRTDGRRERLSEATPSVPAPLWAVLILGGVVAIGLQLTMTDRRERFLVQAAMVAGVAAVVAAGLLLVQFLDHPYDRNLGSIKPAEMRQTLAMIGRQSADLQLACDATGRPISGG